MLAVGLDSLGYRLVGNVPRLFHLARTDCEPDSKPGGYGVADSGAIDRLAGLAAAGMVGVGG